MSQQFALREMQPGDGPALRQLMENDPETPGMAITTRFLVDPYQAWIALKPTMIGVVAEAPGVDGLVGSATVAFEDVQFNGRVLPSAFLENLKVHHAYRKQGMGTKLAQWRIDRARERFGGDCIIMTGTSADNTASLATMKKWSSQFTGPFTGVPRPPRAYPPRPLSGVSVRAAEARDLAAIADKSNRFYTEYNLYPPFSSEKLAAALNGTPQVYHYRIAVDSGGAILAGMMISERSRLMVDEIRNVPAPLRLLNRLIRLIPADNRLRLWEVAYVWFEQLAAVQYLWEYVRWEFRDRASTLAAGFDERTSLKDVFRIRPWHVPKFKVVIAISAPTMLDTERPLSNSLRG